MAEQTVQIKIKVDSKTGEIQLKAMEKGFDKITLTARQAEQAAKQLNTTVGKLTSNGSISATANSYTKLGTAISGTTVQLQLLY
jgi:type II secretory pathway component PulL